MLNQVTITGHIVRDGELRNTNSEHPFVGFTIATSRRRSKDAEEHTAFVDCQIWGERGTKISPYITKGLLVGVSGHIETYVTENDGQKRYYTKIVVDDFVFLESAKTYSQRRSTQVQLDKSTTPDPFASPDAFAKTGAKADIADDDLPF